MQQQEVIFFNIWETHSEENRAGLVAAMRDDANWVAGHAGFVSLKVWSCAEDHRVVIEGRWRSAADFQAAIAENPEAIARREAMMKFGEAKPGVFVTEFVTKGDRA